jgi:hypothetical protein
MLSVLLTQYLPMHLLAGILVCGKFLAREVSGFLWTSAEFTILGFDYGSTGIAILPPFKETRKFPLTTRKATAVAKNNHNKTSSNHAYVRQKGQMRIGSGVLNFPLLLENKFVHLIYLVTS